MIRVAQVTTHAPERCGLATYVEALMRHTTDPEIEYRVIGRPFDGPSVISRVGDADIVHVHHVWALFGGFDQGTVRQLQNMGKKVIVTFNESTHHNASDFTNVFNRVIVHHDGTTDGFTHIPHGVWNIPLPPYLGAGAGFIGTAGFPIFFKNDLIVAKVAKELGMRVMAFLPESPHGDALGTKMAMLNVDPASIITTDYLPTEVIVRQLSQCEFTLFAHTHAGGGISGSVRFGLAARRPTIITKTGRTSDLDKYYQDEVYFIDGNPTIDSAIEMARRVKFDIAQGTEKIPSRCVEEMSWQNTAQQYCKVYREVMGVPVQV